jgi:hypothetical protein
VALRQGSIRLLFGVLGRIPRAWVAETWALSLENGKFKKRLFARRFLQSGFVGSKPRVLRLR